MYRTLKTELLANLDSRQVIILLGPRQVGKTTILKSIFYENAVYIDLDDKVYRDFFDSLSIVKYRSYIDSQLGSYRSKKEKIILVLDEAQRLKDPGLAAKIFYDEIPNVKVILTGSSSLDIRKKTIESLAGRKTTLQLFPLSFQEYLIQKEILHEEALQDFSFPTATSRDDITKAKITEHMLERMRVGLYPGTINLPAESYLHELIEAVIMKDILYMNLVKNTEALVNLLKILGSFIGQPINISDLSKRLAISRQTIHDYIDILEKSYIIFSLKPFRRERDDEIGKYSKIYFYDLGIRNALLNDFRPVTTRNDFESIYKNFILSEIKKLNAYYAKRYDMYYWKTTQGSETDLVLVKDTYMTGIDINLFKSKFSKGFENTYTEAKTYTITLDNFDIFIL